MKHLILIISGILFAVMTLIAQDEKAALKKINSSQVPESVLSDQKEKFSEMKVDQYHLMSDVFYHNYWRWPQMKITMK